MRVQACFNVRDKDLVIRGGGCKDFEWPDSHCLPAQGDEFCDGECRWDVVNRSYSPGLVPFVPSINLADWSPEDVAEGGGELDALGWQLS